MTPRERLDAWRKDPIMFAREEFGIEPDAWQSEALIAFASSDRDKWRIAMKACAGPGKDQPKSMMLYTPDGLRRWGDLVPGDKVFAVDGSITKIMNVFDKGKRRVYRVIFDDGSSTLAGAEHLWKVRGRTERRYWNWDKKTHSNKAIKSSATQRTMQITEDGYSVLSTEQIIQRNKCGDGSRRQFEIPQHGAVYFPHQDLPVDPYVLGVWLGDGSKNGGGFTGIDKEVDAEIISRGYDVSKSQSQTRTIYGLISGLRKAGISHLGSHERFVPEEYRLASTQQRSDILSGLLDTDGCIGTDNNVQFDSTSKRLAEDVVWLTRSLGGKSWIRETIKRGSYKGEDGVLIDCRDCYRVQVTLPFNPFKIKRKSERWHLPQARYLTRYIDNIIESGEEETMCISVDHPSHCYLANDFIVTHNTLVLGICGWNFLACYGEPGDHPKGAAVSITEQNLKTNLWPEFYKLHELSRIKGTQFIFNAFVCTKSRIFSKDYPNTWFIEARSFSKDANPDEQGRTLSGLHAKRVLFLIDESGDIPAQVGKAAEQALSNCTWGKILQAGNPTSTDGMLYNATQRLADQWHVITITGDPADPRRSPRIRIEWAQEQIDKYGRDDPWVMAYILGQFPPNAINSLLSIEDVERAMKRMYRPEQLEGAQKRLGIDVAREGLDKTSLFPRWGSQAFKPIQMSNAKGHDVAARAAIAREKWNWEMCFVDDTGGYGSSVCDSFVQAGVSHVPINFGSKPIDSRYFNRRSEMLFKMADWVKERGALPDIPSLRQEMPALKYTFKQGKLAVIEKDLIKKVIGHSPDDTDALALTFALPEMPGQMPGLETFTRRPSMGEFDPFRETDREQNPMEKYMRSTL